MDPLSITASIVAVWQAANGIISICYNYSAAVKGNPWKVPNVTNEVQSLRDVLESVAKLAERAKNEDTSAEARLPALEVLCEPDTGLLAMCKTELESLEKKLQPSKRLGAKGGAVLQSLSWPLKEGETDRMLKNIERYKTTLLVALQTDQTAVGLETQEMVRLIQAKTSEISEGFAKLELSFSVAKLDEKLGKWLSAPDPSSNHNEACVKRQVSTGDWLIRGSSFAQWKKDKNCRLWLHGIPGCGKTILCSTIIEDVLHECPPAVNKAVAYFYFDFRNTECQHEGMIRSLISQLARQCMNHSNPLVSLYSSCSDGARQPKLCELRLTLRGLVQEFDDTFIVVDALDECKEREQLLADIQEFIQWQLEGLHILVTSRREGDIRVTLDPLVNVNQNIDIQSEVVDRDIRVFVREVIQSAQGLRRWRNKPVVQDEIEKALTENANGMFRWVVCQIDELKKCLNLPMLRKQLKSLPATLPQTYERILLNIGQDYSQYALKLLQWLTYSKRPLSLSELAEVVAIDEDEDPRFDPERRFPEPEDILLICSSLLTATEEEDDDVWEHYPRQRERVRVVKVKLAHFSVKEYLISSQIMNGEARKYSIQEIDANVCIARDCLSYILYFTQDIPKPASNEQDKFWADFPLARYAALKWQEHACIGGEINEESMMELIMKLFTSEGNAFSSWCLGVSNLWDEIRTPLYYASEIGHLRVANRLVTMGVDLNARSGRYGSAICVASLKGHVEIVKLLLEKGADPNSWQYAPVIGSALYWAAFAEHDEIVRLLLDAGAEVRLETLTDCKSALHAAVLRRRTSIAAMLVSSGVDVNINAGEPLTVENYALCCASLHDDEGMVRLLIEAGANSDSKNAALHVASYYGCAATVKVLLDAGVDPNQRWRSASPLREAVRPCHTKTVKILLSAGADVNLGGSWNNVTFYSWVTLRQRQKMLALLVDVGAEITDSEEMLKRNLKQVKPKDETESDDETELMDELP